MTRNVTVMIAHSLRIKRASTYIHHYLYPRIEAIAPRACLSWESTPSHTLIGVPDTARWSEARNHLRRNLVTSGPLSLGIGLAGFVVGCVAVILLMTSNRSGLALVVVIVCASVAALGGAVSGALGIYGYKLTHSVERNANAQKV